MDDDEEVGKHTFLDGLWRMWWNLGFCVGLCLLDFVQCFEKVDIHAKFLNLEEVESPTKNYTADLGAGAMATEPEKDPNIIQNPEIAFIFNPKRDLPPSKAYYFDGNPDLYSNDKVAKRKQLKEDPIVQEAIRDFMNLFSMTAQNIITRDVYFKVFIKIGQILRPNTDAEELQKLIKEDYDRDNGNNQQDTIDSEKLYDSLFELADLWWPNIDENEYKDFFEALKFRFRYGGQNDASAYDIVN